MRGYIANTDIDWYRFLRSQQGIDEVNFWQPSGGRAFRAIPAGAPFFFRLKSPYNAIGGFGYFAGHAVVPLWLAWDSFKVKNGAADLHTFCGLVARHRRVEPAFSVDDAPIGCLMITNPVFFDEPDWVSQPADWAPNIVQGAGCDLTRGEGRRIWRECLARTARMDTTRASEGAPLPAGAERYGAAQVVRPRLGQGSFRIAITEIYDRACAVTSEHSLPALEAAHIRPYASGGEHIVSNGILLRSDLHRLFDKGYVTVTPEYHFEVSRRLKDDFENGRTYYPMRGGLIHLPGSPHERPDPRLLAWHNENVYRG